MKRNLDDQAKIFSLSYNKKDTSIFRISITFVNNIEEKYLNQAVERTLKTFKDFKVKLTKNLFWNELEENKEKLPIHNKIDYNFNNLNTKENNKHLLKVSYEGKQLVIDFFHLLTDGLGAKLFVQELIYNYLRLLDHKLKPQEKLNITSENAYTKNYTNKHNKAYTPPNSYQLKGEYIPNKNISFNDFYINLEDLKNLSKEKECSLSVLIISLIVYSLYETNYKKYNGTKPINVCIPINLRQFFKTKTISNFVSHSMLSIIPNQINSLDNIINLVKEEYTNKIDEQKIKDTFESNGKSINNKLLNYIPLFIKRPIVILGSYFVKKQFTITYSNLGIFDIKDEYSKYIENISFKLIPDWRERIRCGISSNKDVLNISFGSNLIDTSLEKKLSDILDENNIYYEIRSNGINHIKFD